MAIYRYSNPSLIDHIEVHEPRAGLTHATIVATNGADKAQMEELRLKLGGQNISTLMDSAGGKAAIQVRGAKNAEALLSMLEKLGFSREGMQTEIAEGEDRSAGFRERIRGKALFLSALFYDLGNAAFFASGIQRGRHNIGGKFTSNDKSEMMIGAAFSVGDVLMTFMGADRGDEELNAAAQGLKKHLHQKGIDLPDDNTLNPDTLYQSGALKATDRWVRKHIIHIKCLSEFAGGLFTIHSALKPGHRNNGKLAAGFMISTGWLSTLLLERPRGHHIFPNKLEDFLDEKNLSSDTAVAMANNPRGWIARPLAMGNNFANLWGSYQERNRFQADVMQAQKQVSMADTADNRTHLAYAQARQHDYAWNVVSACSFLVAHTLFGISGSRRPTETDDDKAMMNDIVLLSANVLAQQPEQVRNAAIGATAEYVASLNPVSLDKAQVEAAIRGKLADLTHSAWSGRVHVTQTQAPASPQATM